VNSDQVEKAMTELDETWRHQAVSEANARHWRNLLRTVDAQVARKVLDDLATTSKRRPSPAEFSDLCRSLTRTRMAAASMDTTDRWLEDLRADPECVPMPESVKELAAALPRRRTK